jgi:hypothetical protein
MYGGEKCIQVWVGKLEEKRPLPRSMHRLKYIIKEEMGWEVVEWIYLAQSRGKQQVFVCTVMKHRAP